MLKRFLSVAVIVAAAFGCACLSGRGPDARKSESPAAAQSPRPAPSAARPSAEAADAGLSARLKEICVRAGGEYSVAVIHVETNRAAEAEGAKPLPLYSVFKLPLAVAVLKGVEEGRLSLEQKIRVTPADVSPGLKANTDLWREPVERSVREMLELSLVRSDNTSSDQLLKLVGGPAAVTERMRALGLQNIDVRSSVREFISQGGEQNTGGAADLARLLALLQRGEALAAPQLSLLLDLMGRAQTGDRRLRAGVPPGTPVAEKTGTGGPGTSTNDAGLITLPADGGHLAVAVLLSGSKLPEAEQEKVIAEVARAAYEAHTAPASSPAPR